MAVGLLLGTFDPPHIGHIYLAVKALETKQVDEVWLVPAYQSPWKPNATPFATRAFMCKDLTRDYLNIATWTEDKHIKSKSTYEFLKNLKDSPVKFKIICGSDVDITKWINGEWILENFEKIEVSREDFDCSSTKIRNLIKEGKDPRPFITQNVYNIAKRLYK